MAQPRRALLAQVFSRFLSCGAYADIGISSIMPT
jgi:hypothetical protein